MICNEIDVPPYASSSTAMDECSQRIVVTTRLLLRCMWHCLIQHQRQLRLASQLEHRRVSSASTVDVNRSRRLSQSRRSSVTPSSVSVAPTTSRSVYRDVISRQKHQQVAGSTTTAVPVGRGEVDSHHQVIATILIPSVFASSLSFTLLQSTLTMSLALLFLRRLHHVVGVLRPQQLVLSSSTFLRRSQRRVFAAWRDVTRVAVRWRRWALRRCVDHWFQFVQHRLAVRAVLRRFLEGVRSRSRAFRSVCSARTRRCFLAWNHRYAQRTIERQLALRCVQYCDDKQLRHAEYTVRTQLQYHQGHSGGNRSLDASSLSMGHVSTWSTTLDSHRTDLRSYCFRRWVRKTENRLNDYFATSKWHRRTTQRCFALWKARWLLRSGDSISAVEGAAALGCFPSQNVVCHHSSASPTQTVYRLKGFIIAKNTVYRCQLFRRWREKWRIAVADRCYATNLFTRVLTKWIHRAADQRAVLTVKGQVFRSWAAKFFVRRRALFADELHRAMDLQKSWRRWRLRLREQIVARSSQVLLQARCLRKWNDAARVQRIVLQRSVSTIRHCFANWALRTEARRQRNMQELVAEALWQHILMSSTLRLWKDRYQTCASSRRQEQRVFFAIDERYLERLKQKCFNKWRKRRTQHRLP
ncbi:Hypothetical protein, putative [Bodo saltans]|uniref:Sfi1 spindle body domain-containing protein n=1 Tax=Bodo saltans TaxID=75058 RepID=A0A0S4IQ74_BODSA|nr:Hypothetical protein, putative [Bodo saltans]|eukprot:CUF16576.1 Hypothetical protein, putative [Bodo saltans]